MIKKIKIKKNDTVMSLKGKDKGKTGRVIAVFPKKDKVLIEGINFTKKASRPSKNNPQGGIITMEKAVNISNVMIFCAKCQDGVKVSFRILADQKKERFCKKCGETI